MVQMDGLDVSIFINKWFQRILFNIIIWYTIASLTYSHGHKHLFMLPSLTIIHVICHCTSAEVMPCIYIYTFIPADIRKHQVCSHTIMPPALCSSLLCLYTFIFKDTTTVWRLCLPRVSAHFIGPNTEPWCVRSIAYRA